MGRVLVTGGAGQLGTEVIRQCRARGDDVVGTWFRRPVEQARRLDIRDARAVAELINAVRPDVIVHTAYDVGDWETTAVAPVHIARAAYDVGARLVHVSSDAVFSGRAVTYAEDAPPDPINPYGAAKAAAEVGVRAVAPQAAIVRTSLILGGRGASMEALTHALATGEREGVLFTDDIRCPVHVSDLAAALLELAGRPGTFHVAGRDAVSRYELGRLICHRDGLDERRLRTGLRADLPVPGPLALRLTCASTTPLLSTRLRGAREFLQAG